MLKQRRARSAWRKGAQHINHDRVTARGHFERATVADPGMADAWLGVHATGGDDGRAVTAMAHNESRFGEERRRDNRALQSRFSIAPYVTCRLDNHAELWCAVAAHHLDHGENEDTARALERVVDDFLAGSLLRGRLAFVEGRTEDAILHFRRLIGSQDEYFEAAARLLSAIALAGEGAIGPARQHLIWVLSQEFISNAHAEAHLWMAKLARAEGDKDSTRHHLHEAYALRPDFPGLRRELEAEQRGPRVSLGGDSGRPGSGPEAKANGDGVPPESTDDILAELDHQVGLDGVKAQVRAVMAQTRAQVARSQAGLQQARMTEHFVFTGPPGTGKTTIARSIARLYRALGILEKGAVVEVDRSALIGEYLGQTVARTTAKLDEARGGVLFIDEAYALQTDGYTQGDAFGQEAIDTLLKRMEDDRDNLVVIAAGYPEPMQRFLESNPGLRSRFTTTIEFPPYTTWELLEIAIRMSDSTGNTLTPDARRAVRILLERMDGDGELDSPTFGNARFIRNLVEKASRSRDVRLFADTDAPTPRGSELTDIVAEDIEAAI